MTCFHTSSIQMVLITCHVIGREHILSPHHDNSLNGFSSCSNYSVWMAHFGTAHFISNMKIPDEFHCHVVWSYPGGFPLITCPSMLAG